MRLTRLSQPSLGSWAWNLGDDIPIGGSNTFVADVLVKLTFLLNVSVCLKINHNDAYRVSCQRTLTTTDIISLKQYEDKAFRERLIRAAFADLVLRLEEVERQSTEAFMLESYNAFVQLQDVDEITRERLARQTIRDRATQMIEDLRDAEEDDPAVQDQALPDLQGERSCAIYPRYERIH